MNEQFPTEAYEFQEPNSFSVPEGWKNLRANNDEFCKAQLKDYNSRVALRKRVICTVLLILAAQNAIIFLFIGWTIYWKQTQTLQWFLGALLTGTLAETYYTLNLIVKFLSSEINYKPHNIGN